MKQTLTDQPIVFRANTYLVEKSKELAQREMVSQSAICRKALDAYIRTEQHQAELTEHLPSF